MKRLATLIMIMSLICSGSVLAQVNIKHNVTPVPQPSRMSCWAAAATMLLNWKTGIKRSIPQVTAIAGPKFEPIFKSDTGIQPAEETEFYRALNLKIIQRVNPSIQGWSDILGRHGPLSVTVDASPGQGFIHALVVTGLDGDGTANKTIITYIDPDRGAQKAVWFADFLELYECSAN